MEMALTVLQQGLVFLFTFTATLVVISKPDGCGEAPTIRDRLRDLIAAIRRKIEPPPAKKRREGRLSDETWQRVLRVHMINAQSYRRM